MSTAQDSQNQPPTLVTPGVPAVTTPTSPVGPCTPAWSPLSGSKQSMRDLALKAEDQSDVIFEGHMGPGELKEGALGVSGALLSQKKGHHYEMQFEASRVYRGPSKRSFVLFYNAIDTPCAFDFHSGETYLIYADAIPGSGNYVTHAGKLNALLEKAGPALRVLRGESPEPEDLLTPKAYDDRIHARFGSVCGQILGADEKPLPDTVAFLWSVDDSGIPPKDQHETSDSDGHFCIRDVADGKFWLGAVKYAHGSKSRLLGYYPAGIDRARALPVEIAGKATVSGLQIALQQQDLYTVTFRIVPAKHKFHSKPAALIIKSKNGDPFYYHEESDAVDESGRCKPLLAFEPGGYTVSTFFGMRSVGAAAVGLLAEEVKISMPEQGVDIIGNGEVVLRIAPPD